MRLWSMLQNKYLLQKNSGIHIRKYKLISQNICGLSKHAVLLSDLITSKMISLFKLLTLLLTLLFYVNLYTYVM